MGIIINPRGTGGAGKTALVRRVMADYAAPAPLLRVGRARPIGYRLAHPAAGRPLAVLGAYEATRGGCDTIPLHDGGLDEALRLAAELAACGHDVLLEGLALSREYHRSALLAAAHPLHVLHLATPAEHCARALAARHRTGRAAWRHLAEAAARMDAEVEAACGRLRSGTARVERLDFAAALRRIRVLLGLPGQE
jgi:hypothetical protein